MAWLDGQGLEERTIGKLMRRQWERSRWPRVPHVNAHQKVTSGEWKFNHDVDRMAHSVDSQLLSPTLSVTVH